MILPLKLNEGYNEMKQNIINNKKVNISLLRLVKKIMVIYF